MNSLLSVLTVKRPNMCLYIAGFRLCQTSEKTSLALHISTAHNEKLDNMPCKSCRPLNERSERYFCSRQRTITPRRVLTGQFSTARTTADCCRLACELLALGDDPPLLSPDSSSPPLVSERCRQDYSYHLSSRASCAPNGPAVRSSLLACLD